MTTLSFTEVTQRIATLTFHEGQIKNGAMAIARSFKTIQDEGLWIFKTDQDGTQKYESFKDYCLGEWASKYKYISIMNLITEANHEQKVLGGTYSSADEYVPPSKKSQNKAMRDSGASEKDQAESWDEALDEAGGDPDNVDLQGLKDKLDERMRLSNQDFPVGCPVTIDSEVDGMVYNGYEGHVVAHEADKCVSVEVPMDNGKPQVVTVLTNWLIRLQGPCIPPKPKPQPRKKPIKKSPLEQWKEDAIALFNKIYLELGEHLPDDTKQKIINLIEK